MRRLVIVMAVVFLGATWLHAQPQSRLKLNNAGYFEMPGLNVMAFDDTYPEGHQGGISIIQNGVRVATNGDIRLDPVPGQWGALPKQVKREVQTSANQITTWLSFPDPARNRQGFNPVEYPDLKLSYKVRVRGDGASVRISVDLDEPLPPEFAGKVYFNLELFPGALFGRTWSLGGKSGIFPPQPNGPDVLVNGQAQPLPLARGKRLTAAAEVESQRLTIESESAELELLDQRNKHNNGWFVVRSVVPQGPTTNAVTWIVTPHAIPGWKSQPNIHVSQVGYHPKQKKIAVIELDKSDSLRSRVLIRRLLENGGFETVLSGEPRRWGSFLRYEYLQFDFTPAKQRGLYVVQYRNHRSEPFRIADDVYDTGVWQPVLEYFLPIQMCHMRVEEQYRVWHGACHLDDARMAPTNHTHFDGYVQGPSTLTRFQSGETVSGLNVGGWHDAGDDDLRIESQADEVRILASAYEAFGLDYDDTTVDEQGHIAKIHVPDGKPDALQQVEHGVLSILGAYEAMGRFYRGIISSRIQQYVLIGDTANYTDNLFFDRSLPAGNKTASSSSLDDDRWVFTEDNAGHEYKGIAALAAAARVLAQQNPRLAKRCIDAAEALWKEDRGDKGFDQRIVAAVELWLTTGKPAYREAILDAKPQVIAQIGTVGWAVGRVLDRISDPELVRAIRAAVAQFQQSVERQSATPFGVPYQPKIWGAAWDIERFGVEQYYLHRAFPELVSADAMLNALNFVLGVHPGANTASLASGVGAKSTTVAYGLNRADWSYIPGGVVSGTALIRPDFPELKEFPFLWQQTEYVLGGGSSNYMFLVLAAEQVLTGNPVPQSHDRR